MTQGGDMPDARKGSGAAHAPAPRYVNHLRLEANLAEIRLGFGQIPDDGAGLRPVAELVTSPTHFQRFREQIDECLVRYRRQFGGVSGRSDGEGEA